MSRYILMFGFLALAALAGTAAAQENSYNNPPGSVAQPGPLAQPLSQRFVLIVLEQSDRDLARGSSPINMMFDTQTGRSWILEYARKPGTNEAGYVWTEVPYAKPPTD